MNPSEFSTSQTPVSPDTAKTPDRIQEAVHTAKEKLDEVVHTAGEKMSSAGSATLQWVKDNPATALAGLFASGLAVGFALARGARQPNFQERFSDEPMQAIRDAVHSALSPLGARLHDAYDSARSAAGKAADQLHDQASSAHLGDKMRRLGGNLKFW
jgi:ElaB/YqjD/DUF883 family membrane-anchored ribosome-binding protein